MEGCDSLARENVNGMIMDRIEASVSQLTCVTSNICKLSSYETVNCVNSRKKRDTTESNVGFTFKLSCDTTICKYIYFIIVLMDKSSLCINLEICSYKYNDIKWKKNKKHLTLYSRTVFYPFKKSYRDVDKIDTAKIQKHDHLLSWRSTDTSIKIGGLSYFTSDKANK